MITFEQLHPDLVMELPTLKHYVRTNENGTIVEAWTKTDNGQWIDTTAIEREKQRLEKDVESLQRSIDNE
jgi:hypothetical protein